MLVRHAVRGRWFDQVAVAAALLAALVAGGEAASAENDPAASSLAASPWALMVPMEQVGPQPRPVDTTVYARVIHVAPGAQHQTITSALASVTDASPQNRHAILVAAGTYKESRVRMKPYVDLYGGFAANEWKDRDVYQNATTLDGEKKGPVVLGADHARLDGFIITGGEQRGHGGGIVCDGVSPTIINNIIVGNHTLKPEIGQGLGKQVANEGAGIALLSGSSAYVANNLICENSTAIGAGAGIAARGNVQAKILRNVFCNNIAGVADDAMFHGKVGSRSSPGGAIACAEESSPQISFNVIVLGSAPINNDAGGIWVEGNSMPPINYNWIVGNTSGDDGGGIYVMGNLYYDQAGKRHDLSPDGPVAIEGNIITGNNCIRGGPGGVRASRFGRVDLRRNLIVGNEKGSARGAEGAVITVMEDNLIADNGAKREPATPRFRLAGDVTGRKFDARRYATEIATSESFAKGVLPGNVVRVGAQWSVVKSSSPAALVIWGKITDDAARIELLDDYSASN